MKNQENENSRIVKYIGFFLLFTGVIIAWLIVSEIFTFLSQPEDNLLVQYMTAELSKTNFATFNGSPLVLEVSGAFSVAVFLFALLIWTASSVCHHIIKSSLVILTRSYSADISRLK